MKVVENDFKRLLKIWWSFMWRSSVLTIPVMFAVLPIMFLITPFPKPGTPPQAIGVENFPYMFLKMGGIWMLMMIGGTFMQLVALKWTLKTTWSDFKVKLVSNDD